MNKILILGGGIAGLSAGYFLSKSNKSVKIYEKLDTYGGLCGGFTVASKHGDFWFDYGPHFCFSNNSEVKRLFFNSSERIKHIPKPLNYYNGFWIKHPAQNNLYGLPLEVKISCIKDMVKSLYIKNKISNFEDWLKAQYGEYFTYNFSNKYTRKYWAIESKYLSTNESFVGKRFYLPNLDEILQGSMTDDTPITYYAKSMNYPKKGKFKSFLNDLKNNVNINFNKEVVRIDTKNQIIYFNDGSCEGYNTLISTIPLPELVRIIKDVPKKVIKAANQLKATSMYLVSLGFRKDINIKELWYYIYDEDKKFARIYLPHKKSLNNVPKNCSSLQVEICFSDFIGLGIETTNVEEVLIKHVKEKIFEMGIIDSLDDIVCEDCRLWKYANIIFYKGMEKNRDIVLDYLNSIKLYSCGRFGEWDYLWSDQSFLSGKKIASIITQEDIKDSAIDNPK